jgi:hypothetical protein
MLSEAITGSKTEPIFRCAIDILHEIQFTKAIHGTRKWKVTCDHFIRFVK